MSRGPLGWRFSAVGDYLSADGVPQLPAFDPGRRPAAGTFHAPLPEVRETVPAHGARRGGFPAGGLESRCQRVAEPVPRGPRPRSTRGSQLDWPAITPVRRPSVLRPRRLPRGIPGCWAGSWFSGCSVTGRAGGSFWLDPCLLNRRPYLSCSRPTARPIRSSWRASSVRHSRPPRSSTRTSSPCVNSAAIADIITPPWTGSMVRRATIWWGDRGGSSLSRPP